MIEREVKLAVPAGFRRPLLRTVEGVHPGAVTTTSYTTTYYDSSDLTLAAWGVSLRYRSGEGWTVKLATVPEVGLVARPEHAFAGPPDGPPAEALRLLRGYLRGRAVVAVAEARTTRRRQVLANARGRTVLAVVDDTVATSDEPPRAMRQLEVELLDGRAKVLLARVVDRLERAGARAAGAPAKYEWLLGQRLPPPVLPEPRLDPDLSLGDATRALIARSVRRLMPADAAIRAGDGPEAVHQARVAARRLRADLRVFAEVLEPEWSADLRRELEWASGALGKVRDLEVLAERIRSDARRLGEPKAARTVLKRLRPQVAAARAELAGVMSEPRYLALLDRLLLAAHAPPLSTPAAEPAGERLAPAVDRAWRRLRRAARQARDEQSDDVLHLVRIRTKQARYAAESLAPLLGAPAARFARRATSLQDALGEHQDAVVAWTWLRDAAMSKTAASQDGFSVGQLAGLEIEARRRAREAWPVAWRRLRKVRPATWR